MKILVVRFRQIGDALISSVVCNTLKKSFPDAEVDYLLYDFIEPIFVDNKAGYNIITLNKKERENVFCYFFKAWKITRKKYDIVIDLMSTPRSEIYSLLSPQAKFRIGWGGEKEKSKKFRGLSYTHKVYEVPKSMNQVTKFLRILKPLEEAGYKINYDINFNINISEKEKQKIHSKMENSGIDFKKKIYAFAINTRRASKSYPKERMKELIKLFLEKYSDTQIIFFYSKEEKEYAKKMHEDLKNDKRIFSNIETNSIKELASLFSVCDMFVGNEGGPRHIAEAVNIPTFCFLSGRQNWFPEEREKHFVLDNDNLDLMTPEILFDELQKFISKF